MIPKSYHKSHVLLSRELAVLTPIWSHQKSAPGGYRQVISVVACCVALLEIFLSPLVAAGASDQASEPPISQRDGGAGPVPITQFQTGAELAQAMHRRDTGVDSVSRGTMELVSSRGRTRTRELRIFQLNGPDSKSTTLIRFFSPASIAGTALLDSPEANGMWIYLPALDRTRRVSSSNGGGRFVNSQYYYEDLSERVPDDDNHVLGERSDYEGIEVLTITSIPKNPDDSVYSARKSWVHPELLLPLRVDFYEEGSDAPSKRLVVLQIDQIQGYWTVMASRMTDLHTLSTTTITVDAIQYNQDLPKTLFTTNTLGLRDASLPFVP